VYIALRAASVNLEGVQRRLERMEEGLKRRLLPKWQSRDVAKANYNSMPGRDWKSNPRPKRREADERKADELRLRRVQECLAHVQEVQRDLKSLEDSAKSSHAVFSDAPLPFYEPFESDLSSSGQSSRDASPHPLGRSRSRSRSRSQRGANKRGGKKKK
jgi:hypothetical protein